MTEGWRKETQQEETLGFLLRQTDSHTHNTQMRRHHLHNGRRGSHIPPIRALWTDASYWLGCEGHGDRGRHLCELLMRSISLSITLNTHTHTQITVLTHMSGDGRRGEDKSVLLYQTV